MNYTHRKLILLCTAFALMVTLNSSSFAFGSKEKSPQQKAAESEKKATESYNNGVKQMDNAKKIASGGDSTYAFNYRATSDAKAKKVYEKAVKNFETAVALKADFPEAYNNLGYCYRKLDNLKKSLEAYHKALELKPEFPQANEYLGETFLAMDSLQLALGQYQILQDLKSPYADTLMKSIEIYKLAKVSEKMNGNKNKGQ